jgi:hypothetical protein
MPLSKLTTESLSKLTTACEGPLQLKVVAPCDNSITPYAVRVPILVACVEPDPEWEWFEDPDIELVLFADLDDAVELIALSIPKEGTPNKYPGGLSYAVFEVKEGFVAAWVDEQLDWGGNLLYYEGDPEEKKALIDKSLSYHSDCHCSENIFSPYEASLEEGLRERWSQDGPVDEEKLSLWVSIIGQLNEEL